MMDQKQLWMDNKNGVRFCMGSMVVRSCICLCVPWSIQYARSALAGNEKASFQYYPFSVHYIIMINVLFSCLVLCSVSSSSSSMVSM